MRQARSGRSRSRTRSRPPAARPDSASGACALPHRARPSRPGRPTEAPPGRSQLPFRSRCVISAGWPPLCLIPPSTRPMAESGWRRPTARCAGSAAARRSPGRPRLRWSCSTRRWSASGSAIPICRGSTCSSCSPSSTRPASRCRRRRGWPRRSASRRRRPMPRPRRSCFAPRPALLATLEGGLAGARRAPGPRPRRSWRLRWSWAPAIAQRLRRPERDERWLFSRLPEWEEARRPAGAADGAGGRGPRPSSGWRSWSASDAEVREGQRDYAAAAAGAFDPRAVEGQPNMLLAEAGTGIGKTLGYLAPASLWAESADGAVWVSTFTKALQRQLDREGLRLFPDAGDAARARSSSARGARITSACSTSRTRCRAASPAAPRSSPSWSRAGPLSRRTATWSAATCRAGFRPCSAAPARPRSPTAAANASMPAARITANASSSARRGPARTPTSSSPTMPW